jgi:hypothetical protein
MPPEERERRCNWESGPCRPADLAIDDDLGRGEAETLGDAYRRLMLRMHVCDEALHTLATQPRCHADGRLAGTSPALISASDHPRKLCRQAFAIMLQGRLDYAYGRSGGAVTHNPIQPSFVPIWRPPRLLPSVAIMQLAPGRRAAADVPMQRLVGQEGSHLDGVISSQRLQRQARRLDHIGGGPFRLDQHPPTLSRIATCRLTADLSRVWVS